MRISLETLGKRALGLLQRGAARHLDVVPERDQVRRGERLAVRVTASGDEADALDVGVICTETYASFVPSNNLSQSDRMLLDDVAYERWWPLDGGGSASVEVPADGPFSYDGEHLKFKWRVAARQQRRGVDAVRTRDLHVLP